MLEMRLDLRLNFKETNFGNKLGKTSAHVIRETFSLFLVKKCLVDLYNSDSDVTVFDV